MGIPMDRAPSRSGAAADLINTTITELSGRGGTPVTIVEALRERSCHDEATQPQVRRYIAALQEVPSSATFRVLAAGVGGQYDTESHLITMNPDAVEVQEGEGVETAARRLEEIGRHEGYHQKHRHHHSLFVSPPTEAGTVITIGQEGFTATEFFEGVTVARTGCEFVSAQYRAYMGKLLRAIDAAPGLSLEGVEEAVDRRDLPSISDEHREREEGDPSVTPDVLVAPFAPSPPGGVTGSPSAAPRSF